MNKPLGILRFNLEDFDQARDFEASLKGPKLKNAVDNIYDEVFRPCLKYNASFIEDKDAEDIEIALITAVWEKLHNYLKERGCFYDE